MNALILFRYYVEEKKKKVIDIFRNSINHIELNENLTTRYPIEFDPYQY